MFRQPRQPNAAAPPQPLWDWAIVCALAALHVGCVWYLTGDSVVYTYDTFRDLATARHLAAGNFTDDPMAAAAPAWYPPLQLWLIGELAEWLDSTPLEVLSSSRYWLSVWLPITLYLLVRSVWDRTTGLAATALVWLGSAWWHTHGQQPVPSVQGAALLLAGLTCWHRGARGDWRWLTGAGLLLGLAAWQHPINALMLGGTVAGHTLLDLLRPPLDLTRGLIVRRAFATLGAATVIGGWSAWYRATMPRVNIDPMIYFSGLLLKPTYALQAHFAAIWPLAAIGLALWWRRRPTARWLLVYLTLAAVGQLSAYAAKLWGWPTPVLVPHEFQWHGQLALGILAATTVGELARRSRSNAPADAPLRPAVARTLLVGVALALALAIRWLPNPLAFTNLRNDPTTLAGSHRATTRWIERNTTLRDVFACEPEIGYRVVAGLTARRVIAVSAAHMSPTVDVAQRVADVDALLNAASEAELRRVCERYGVDYVLRSSPAPAALDAALELRYADPAAEAWIYAVRPNDSSSIVNPS